MFTMELHRFVPNVAVQQLNNSLPLDCSQCCSYQQQGFFEIWHDKTQHYQFYCAEESFLLSFPMPDEFLSLDSSLLADLKAPPVQTVDVQPMTCTGFLVFPQEVRVVLLECAAKATISAHFYHCILLSSLYTEPARKLQP